MLSIPAQARISLIAYIYHPGVDTHALPRKKNYEEHPPQQHHMQHESVKVYGKYLTLPGQAARQRGAASHSNKQQQAKKAKIELRDNRFKIVALIKSLCWNLIELTTVQDELVRNVD